MSRTLFTNILQFFPTQLQRFRKTQILFIHTLLLVAYMCAYLSIDKTFLLFLYRSESFPLAKRPVSCCLF